MTVPEIVEVYLKIENMTKAELCHCVSRSAPNLAGPRVRKTERQIIPDTAASAPLRNTHTGGNDMMFQELYRDQMDRCFTVRHAMWKGGVYQATPIGQADAGAVYKRFSAAGDANDTFREGSGDNE